MPDKPVLTREALLNGDVERLTREGRKNLPTMTDAQREDLVEQTLKTLGSSAELWVFGYGSLIWNPAIDFEAQRRCRIKDYQRKFCFWTSMSRGSVEYPGLMVGLVDGDGCDGVAYLIERSKAATELDILYRRELFSFVYKPVWVDAVCSESNTDFRALTFVVDTENERYVHQLAQSEIVKTIATAHGPLGSNCDYLFQLAGKLRELGFEDHELDELEKQVIAFQKTAN